MADNTETQNARVLGNAHDCMNGWPSPNPCSYTDGCYCVRGRRHAGRCRCVCGSTRVHGLDCDCNHDVQDTMRFAIPIRGVRYE